MESYKRTKTKSNKWNDIKQNLTLKSAMNSK